MLSLWKFSNAMTSTVGNVILVLSVNFEKEACNIITSTSAEIVARTIKEESNQESFLRKEKMRIFTIIVTALFLVLSRCQLTNVLMSRISTARKNRTSPEVIATDGRRKC